MVGKGNNSLVCFRFFYKCLDPRRYPQKNRGKQPTFGSMGTTGFLLNLRIHFPDVCFTMQLQVDGK